jgi:uncharacterized membrane protein YbhN (UPF0104 family)
MVKLSRPGIGAVARPGAGVAVLAVVTWRLGFGPFRDGMQALDLRALALAVALGAVSTACCAWRWTLIARRHGLRLTFGSALAAYYRSVFLNLTLPGGVVGDVHRGLRHGRSQGEAGRALRVVALERGIGQAVQIIITIAVLIALASPVGRAIPAGLAASAMVAGIVLLVVRRGGRRRPDGRRLASLAVASSVVVFANAAMFLVAAHTAGVSTPATRLLPLALLAMLAMVLPSVAGWGPREGATAWVFGAAGLGASAGVATAVVYGVMALAAALPGALVLVAAWSPGVAQLGPREAADA